MRLNGTGTFVAYWGALAAALLLAAKTKLLAAKALSVRWQPPEKRVAMRRGRPVAEIAFWTTMAVNAALWRAELAIESAHSGTDSYAIGAAALVPYAVEVFAAACCFAFALVKWSPLRWVLAIVSGGVAASGCIALA